MRRAVAMFILSFLLVLLTIRVTPEADAFCLDRSYYCSGQGHKTITYRGLDFLAPGVLSDIYLANASQDYGNANERPELHFTNCLFTEATEYIRRQYGLVVDAIDPGVDSQEATLRWGQLLHSVQDFYSHSAWVDPVPEGLGFGTTHPARKLDGGLGNWRRLRPYERLFPNDSAQGDILVVQGDFQDIWPRAWVDLPRRRDGNPTSAVPILAPGGIFGTARYRGLMTASAAPFENDKGQCPPAGEINKISAGPFGAIDVTCLDEESVCIRHGGGECFDAVGMNKRSVWNNCLNHDRDSRRHWPEAFLSATAQTKHEWCRLLHLTRDRKGLDAASIPLALWVGPDSTPHPDGTACSRARKGPDAVVIEFEGTARRGRASIRDLDPGLSFVAYTDDFRESVRMQSNRGTMNGRVKLCVNPADKVALTLWGWQNGPPDPSDRPRPGSRQPDLSFSPQKPVLSGRTIAFGGPRGATGASGRWQTDDLTMTYRTTRVSCRVSANPDTGPRDPRRDPRRDRR